jgi:hypothetical protein
LGIFSNGKPEKVQFGSGTSYEATFKITPDEVIDLLGKPAGRVDDDLIFYGLGHDGVFIYIMQIVFDHGICVGASVGTSIN